jgi:ABC-type phosphate transport system substrate-binding protein
MNKIFRIATALVLSAASHIASADIVIIAHPDIKADNVDTDSIRNLYLGERTSLPNGMPVEPINHVKGSPDRELFFTSVLSMNEKTHKRHWKRMQATRTTYQPKEVSSHTELLESIANTPGSIGYIDESLVDDSVKVLMKVHTSDV